MRNFRWVMILLASIAVGAVAQQSGGALSPTSWFKAGGDSSEVLVTTRGTVKALAEIPAARAVWQGTGYSFPTLSPAAAKGDRIIRTDTNQVGVFDGTVWNYRAPVALEQSLRLPNADEYRFEAGIWVGKFHIDEATRKQNAAVAAEFGPLTNAFTNVVSTAPYTLTTDMLSTFSGWGGWSPARPAFDTVGVYVAPFNPSFPVTSIRVRVHENDYLGTVLADTTVSGLSFATNSTAQRAIIPLGTTVSTTLPIYVEWFTNGRTGNAQMPLATFTEPPSPRSRYSTSGNTTTLSTVLNSSQRNIYFETGNTAVTPEFNFASGTARAKLNPLWDGKLITPSQKDCVVAVECSLYFENLLSSPGPAGLYKFDVVSSKGVQQQERWTLTPVAGDVGTSTLTINLWYGDEIISTTNTTLNVVNTSAGAGIIRKYLGIGDSTVSGGFGIAAMKALADADPAPYRITPVGTQTASGVAHEGYPGQTVAWFYSDPASPFTFGAGNTFDFAQYLTANSITMSAGDTVAFTLGINDFINITSLAVAKTQAATMLAQINLMITSIQTAVPGIRVVFWEVTPPSSSQDSFGANYGSGLNRDLYARVRAFGTNELRLGLEGRTGSNVWYGAYGSAVDTLNNVIKASAAPVNSRSTVLAARQANGVHFPLNTSEGYGQLGDATYAFMKARQ